MEKGEDAAINRPEDSSERDAEARLEWWEVAEREAEEADLEAAEAMAAVREAEKAEEDNRAMIEEHRVVKDSITKKLEKDRSRAFNDVEASGSGKEIICISDSDEE